MANSVVSKISANKNNKEKSGNKMANSQSYSSQKQQEKHYYPSPFKNTSEI
jgi:hypothetical protein